MERVDVRLRVLVDDPVGNDDWATFVGCANAVHGKAPRQTGDGSKQTLKCLGKVVGDIILINLRGKVRGINLELDTEIPGSWSTRNLLHS